MKKVSFFTILSTTALTLNGSAAPQPASAPKEEAHLQQKESLAAQPVSRDEESLTVTEASSNEANPLQKPASSKDELNQKTTRSENRFLRE